MLMCPYHKQVSSFSHATINYKVTEVGSLQLLCNFSQPWSPQQECYLVMVSCRALFSVTVLMPCQDIQIAVGCWVVCRPTLQHHDPEMKVKQQQSQVNLSLPQPLDTIDDQGSIFSDFSFSLSPCKLSTVPTSTETSFQVPERQKFVTWENSQSKHHYMQSFLLYSFLATRFWPTLETGHRVSWISTTTAKAVRDILHETALFKGENSAIQSQFHKLFEMFNQARTAKIAQWSRV